MSEPTLPPPPASRGTPPGQGEKKKDFAIRFNSFAGKAGMVTGLLLFPFVFEKIFAMGPLRSGEWNSLQTFAIFLVTLSAILFFLRTKVNAKLSLLFFSFVFLISVELIARLSVKTFGSSATIKTLREECNWTYMDSTGYSGHPFLQFTGRPSVALKGNQSLGKLPPFNNFGFIGRDFIYKKPSGTIRIACLGESTTADGYPAFLESYLSSNRQDNTKQYEVMNFGHAYWTTNHSLVNFILNVLDFHPDYIVIHHGWNEEKVRNVPPSEYRGDYSHTFKVFERPHIADKYPIRLSIIYRMIKFSYDKNPSWASLGGSVQYPRKETGTSFANLNELKPYQRNLENIIDLALLRNIKVVLTTLPHSTDSLAPLYYAHTSIDQCNAITRSIAKGYSKRIYFVDLDSLFTGRHNEFFKDLAHVTDAGRTMKSEAIGKVILGDIRESTSNPPQ